MKYQIDYAFDPMGNVNKRVINGLLSSVGSITARYQYDVMNRLTNEVCLTNGLSGGQTNSWVHGEAGNWRTDDGEWRLNNADNELIGIATSNAPAPNPQNHVVEFRYHGANRIANRIAWVEGQPREKRFDSISTNGFTRLTPVTAPRMQVSPIFSGAPSA